ncbi:hypothetical protein GGR57DRAFT_498215 [Xylariaceae sp. FL1272]|nr:hypothetical protein GGR57DRAFT_498215 [Xylariaceae sp. FL1272]
MHPADLPSDADKEEHAMAILQAMVASALFLAMKDSKHGIRFRRRPTPEAPPSSIFAVCIAVYRLLTPMFDSTSFAAKLTWSLRRRLYTARRGASRGELKKVSSIHRGKGQHCGGRWAASCACGYTRTKYTRYAKDHQIVIVNDGPLFLSLGLFPSLPMNLAPGLTNGEADAPPLL